MSKLKAAGIEIITDVLADEARTMNRRFLTFFEKQRPHIILKWAETSDGFIARENYDSKWISDEFSRQLVHQWRAQEDAVLVGSQTALHDDPQLNVRDWTGRDPIRIVIDRSLKLQSTLRLFDGSQKTLCYNQVKNDLVNNTRYIKLDAKDFIPDLVKDLYDQKIQSLIIEGGAQTLQHFFQVNLWDEARVFVSGQSFGKGIKAPQANGPLKEQFKLKSDWLRIYRSETILA
jgi:diaminohydroxyphosphoribosylaminopyrimidine deaminase/5-amino-6-(5-phosphoribosylamino)uracil reductase